MPSPSIIAATDFTPRSAQVTARAAAIATAMNLRLILAHVLPEAAAQDAPLALSAAGADENGEEDIATLSVAAPEKAETGRLARLGRLFLRPADLPAAEALRLLEAGARSQETEAEIRLVFGRPGPALAQLAAEENAALIVLGLHRERRLLEGLALTSMEEIVMASDVPVLIAHQRPANGYKKVLALSDFSPASAAALIMAGQIAPQADFYGIHALHLPLGRSFAPEDPAVDAAITQAELLRETYMRNSGLPAMAAPPEIVPGGVHEVLAFRQEELGADLVCIGTHSGREMSRLGNYARDLMRAPPTDLLVAKPA